ncbi:MAG: TonB-dependent siderophore receptor [Pseudomonadales bacterium]|jgi:catecholate siderophore receptor|nr:TonB-dependent siderophore receptor [Pseudomonadales bacterium]
MHAPKLPVLAAAVRAAALSSLALAGSLALAQESAVEELVVEGKYLSLDQLDAVKTPTPILDVPQSLSIVGEQQIEDQAFQGIGDVLRYTPGLAISQGEGHRDAIIIRGIQSTADFFVDGLRDDVQYYRPLYNVQQVEVLRGSNALLFGRGGGGGVINRVQKKPVLNDTFTTVDLGMDTFGAWTTTADVNVDVGDRAAFRLNAYAQGLENHRDVFEGDSFAVNPTLKVELAEATTAFLSYEYVDDDRVVDRGVPSVVTAGGPNEPLEGFEDTFFGSPDRNDAQLEAHLLRGRIDHRFSDALRGNVTVQYADYDKAYQNLYPNSAVVVTNGTFPEVTLDGYRDTTQRENLIAQANLVGELVTGAIEHTVLFGLEAGSQDTGNARLDTVFEANGDDQIVVPFTDPLQIPAFDYSDLSRDRDSEVRFTSVYLQDQIGLTEQVKLLVGFRYDRFDIEVFDRIEAGDGDAVGGDFDRLDEEITPRLGLIYKPMENVSLYASYSETFLPLSGEQFLTLDLTSEGTRPQFFENRELGLKWDLRDDLAFTSSIFELQQDSFTSIDPVNPEQVILVEGSRIRGAEFQLTGALTERWAITTGYSYLDGEVERADGTGFDGNSTRQTPEHMFSIWNSVQVTGRLRLGLGATYQDSFFVQEDNSVEVPSYTRLDAAAYYRVSPTVRVQLNVENLLDEEYFPDAHSNTNITTGRPLNARLTVSMDL